jgi:hydroxymethylbilane synthase
MQSEQVRQALLATGCVDEIEVQTITTRGDKILDVPLAKVGGKGLFVKEIEEALLDETIDFAVHSLKDMPVRLPDGLVFGATPEREDPRDLLVCREVSSLEEMWTPDLRSCGLRLRHPWTPSSWQPQG